MERNIFSIVIILVFVQIVSGQLYENFEYKKQDNLGEEILIKRNQLLNCPHRIYNLKVDLKKYGQVDELNIENLLEKFFQEYQSILKVDYSKLKVVDILSRKGRLYIDLVQHYSGIDVYGSEIGISLNQNGSLRLFRSTYFSNIDCNISPQISEDQASAVASNTFLNFYGKKPDDIRKSPSLYIYPEIVNNEIVYYLAYNLELKYRDGGVDICQGFWINAMTGECINRYSIGEGSFTCTVSGQLSVQYWPEFDTDDEQTAYAKDCYVSIIDITGDEVNNTHGYTNNSGYYNIVFSAASLSYYWVKTISDGIYIDWSEANNYIYSSSFHDQSSVVYNLTFPISEDGNLFYHVNNIHSYIKYTHNYNAMDYKMDILKNSGGVYGSKATGTDIEFDCLDDIQWERSSDIIYHEYTHNVVYHIYGHFIGSDNYGQDDAMEEGISDYFACTLNGDDLFGEHVGINRDLTNTRVYNGAYDKYWNSVVFSGACWDLRGLLGTTDTDELVFDALFDEPYDFDDFLNSIIILDDDDSDLSNGTPHLDDILIAFYGHSIYPSNSAVPPLTPQNFSGTWYSDHPKIYWTANTEPDFKEYEVWKKRDSGSWNLRYHGTNTYYIDYSEFKWTKPQLPSTLYYKVRAVDDADQTSEFTSQKTFTVNAPQQSKGTIGGTTVSIDPVPLKYQLHPAFPNPFNATTTLKLDLPEKTTFSFIIYDIKGLEVWSLNNRHTNSYSAGYHTIQWDGKDNFGSIVPTGVYFIVYNSSEYRLTQKVVLLK